MDVSCEVMYLYEDKKDRRLVKVEVRVWIGGKLVRVRIGQVRD